MEFLSLFKPRAAAAGETDNENVVTLRPRYAIRETGDGYEVTVELPGVSAKTLEATVEDGAIDVVGRVAWRAPKSWRALDGDDAARVYRLRLSYGEDVDDRRVDATLADGELRIRLPKVEEKKPRRIAVS